MLQSVNDLEKIDLVFTHTSSPKMWHEFATLAGIEHKIYPISEKTGNIVTTSVPVAMNHALQADVLKKGVTCLSLLGRADMVLNVTWFSYL